MNKEQHTASGSLRPESRRRARVGVAAFTLIELLVVTAILAVVVGVIGASLSGGIRVWDTVRAYGQAEAELGIGLRILERDLSNALPFCDVGFRGEPAEVSFGGLMREARGAGLEGTGVLAVVKYRYDAGKAALVRTRQPCGAGAAANEALAETVLTGVQGLAFGYVAAGAGAGAQSARADWPNSGTNFPALVHVKLTTKSEGGTRQIVRTYPVPVQVQDVTIRKTQ
jgi:prepilin-type N-terminal cleavage/methylation domain-containing protein